VDEGKKTEEKKRCYQATDAAKNWEKKKSINDISESFTADVLPWVTASCKLGST
jgi:hypothetical protein